MNDSRDHREVAKSLDLYLLDKKIGQGLPILLPNYTVVRNQIQEFIRKQWKKFDFKEVVTPLLSDKWIYETSGHLQHYQEYMYPIISKNEEDYCLKAMTCPLHCLVYQSQRRYRQDLPLRISENSTLFRYESSGSLKGLERVRTMEMPDHHIFVTPEGLKEELKANFYFIQEILSGLDCRIEKLTCSFHDPLNKEKYHPDSQLWEKSETFLKDFLGETKLEYDIQIGQAAFYGPKLDFEVVPVKGKAITLATLQLDFLLPQKFGLKYLDSNKEAKTPIIIHQSPIGTYQRFIALLLEQKEGKLPFWLSPTQLVVLPINDKGATQSYCQKLRTLLEDFRVEVWSKRTLGFRLQEVHHKKIPYFLVIGQEEVIKNKLILTSTFSGQKTEVETLELSKLLKDLSSSKSY